MKIKNCEIFQKKKFTKGARSERPELFWFLLINNKWWAKTRTSTKRVEKNSIFYGKYWFKKIEKIEDFPREDKIHKKRARNPTIIFQEGGAEILIKNYD